MHSPCLSWLRIEDSVVGGDGMGDDNLRGEFFLGGCIVLLSKWSSNSRLFLRRKERGRELRRMLAASMLPRCRVQERHVMKYISTRCYVIKDSSRIEGIGFGDLPELSALTPNLTISPTNFLSFHIFVDFLTFLTLFPLHVFLIFRRWPWRI